MNDSYFCAPRTDTEVVVPRQLARVPEMLSP